MFKNLSIRTKITALVVVVVLITVTVISLLSFNFSQDTIQNRYAEALKILADSRADKIQSHFNKVIQTLDLLGNAPAIVNGADPVLEDQGKEYDVNEYLHLFKGSFQFDNIYLVNRSGKILHSTDSARESGSNFIDPDGQTLANSFTGIYFSDLERIQDEYFLYAGAPVKHESEERSILLIRVKLSEVNMLLRDATGLGRTGEMILARADTVRKRTTYINKLRNNKSAALVSFGENENIPGYIIKALGQNEGIGSGIDYRGKRVLAAWEYIPNTGWGIVAKIDTEEIYGNSRQLLGKFILSGIIISMIAIILSLIFSQHLIKPIKSLKNSLQLLNQGMLPSHIKRESFDEIGDMAETTNNLVLTLKETAGFAKKIGEGDFDARFRPVSDQDLLGNSLVTMRKNLIKAERSEKERSWIITGVAEMSTILRAVDDLEALGDEVIKYIVNKIDAVQGAFYILNDDDPEDQFLEMTASYAYNRKKYLMARFKFAEGLVGQAAAEKDTILRIEIPEDYVSVSSGILGDKKPGCILIVPLIAEEKVYGALEFAGFSRFDESKVKFVEELSLSLARTIFNIKVNERTRKLLEESQVMSSELQEQQEVLRQNTEEMQATQEELTRSNIALEEQVAEVKRAQKRMQLLLENASEVITIYEEDETIRYISPSVEPILGYSQNEMINSSDINNVHEDYKDVFHQMFTDLKKRPLEQVSIQYEYKTKEGNYIWIQSTGTNFLSNSAINGFIINSRDITERHRAEMEQRMRSKMQALSENSPDLIARIENEMISYINPVIEEYTGNKPLSYLNQPVNTIELHEQVLQKWLDIVKKVNESDKELTTEMEFPSSMGKRIMQVNAIPEYDENKHLESVLVVSHDITDRKLIELEIHSKNKKIADSINYARRIQGAILPDTFLVNKALPQSFILYKPKDVVSGDFPWFLKIGDIIYIAAVDCTGHGVPGALLSLIGYFLLNDIVRSRNIEDPGAILDQLDEGVTQTLRQDENDSKTKDGMDIALCRIDIKNKTVRFAGAHRSLYIVKNNEMEEIKGNKFAIGGGIYKNQTNFSTHDIELAAGDSFYFCSDGFPDQFGGPDNRKLGPKRLRELIMQNHMKDSREAYKVFDSEWESWKGDEKQTDDVLLIGIKF
jgi:PAS domain S-box-containing protein